MAAAGVCSHTLSVGYGVRVRARSGEGSRAVSHRSVCAECRQSLMAAGVVFLDSLEEEAWLAGRGEDDQPTA